MKEFRFTLYEVFGYFLPGLVMFASLALHFWCIYLPKTPLQIEPLNSQSALIFVVLSYFLGHLCQAAANTVPGKIYDAENEILKENGPDPPTNLAVTKAKHRLAAQLGAEAKLIDAKLLFRAMDEAIVQRGVGSEREVFQYREGFYRGLSLAFGVSSLGILVRMITPGTVIIFNGVNQPFPARMLLFPLALSIVATWLFYMRFKRFSRYRVERSLLAYHLLIEMEPSSGPREKNGEKAGR